MMMCEWIAIISMLIAIGSLGWCLWLHGQVEQRKHFVKSVLAENNRLRLDKKTLRARIKRGFD